MGVIGRCGRTVVLLTTCSSPMRFGRDSRSSFAKIHVPFCVNFGVAQQTVVSQALFYDRQEECSVVQV